MRLFCSTDLLLDMLRAQSTSLQKPASILEAHRRRSIGDSAPRAGSKAAPKQLRKDAPLQIIAP